MKNKLRKFLRPILAIFESGEGEFDYKSSHRLILKVVGSLFLVLSTISLVAGIVASQMGALLPSLVFFLVGFVCLVVGFLGNDRAVARIWSRR